MARKPTRSWLRCACWALALSSALACDSSDATHSDPMPDDSDATYIIATLIASNENEGNMYVSLFDELDGQTIDNSKAREYSGTSDLWVYEGAIYIADKENLTITKYEVAGHELAQKQRLSFTDYGLSDFGFWLNSFVDAHKAYLANAASEYVIWDPTDMKITGTLSFPEFAAQDGKEAYPAYADRAAKLRDGLLYQPIYFTDDTFFEFTPETKLLVIDTKRDEVVDVLDVPCPGVDYATVLDNGDVYLSSWVFAPAGATLDAAPKTCVAKLPANEPKSVEPVFDIASVTDGREGGVFRYLGDGKAMLSVLHVDKAESEGVTDIMEVGLGPYWRFWSYDFASKAAKELDSIDWNSGAAYNAEVSDRSLILAPQDGYARTVVYDLGAGTAEKVLETEGWALRLFAL